MKEVKYHLYLDDKEQIKLLKALINLKNDLIAQGKYHEPVDELTLRLQKPAEKSLE